MEGPRRCQSLISCVNFDKFKLLLSSAACSGWNCVQEERSGWAGVVCTIPCYRCHSPTKAPGRPQPASCKIKTSFSDFRMTFCSYWARTVRWRFLFPPHMCVLILLLQQVRNFALCYGVLNGIAYLCEHVCLTIGRFILHSFEFFPYFSENAITILRLCILATYSHTNLYRMTWDFLPAFCKSTSFRKQKCVIHTSLWLHYSFRLRIATFT